jgi:hypothetical protein
MTAVVKAPNVESVCSIHSRHPELVSGSYFFNAVGIKTLKQVQGDEGGGVQGDETGEAV